MPRFKDVDWNLDHAPGAPGKAASWAMARMAVLMDIRDELRAIRARLDCHETLAIPRTLRAISRKLAKPRRCRTTKGE